jgi:hypothetical protein
MFTFLQLPVSSADRLDTLLEERPVEPVAVVVTHDHSDINPGDVMLRVSAGTTPLTKMIYLNAEEHTALLAEIDTYNADPERGWAALVEELARRVAPIRTALLAQRASNIGDVAATAARSQVYRQLRFGAERWTMPEPPTHVRISEGDNDRGEVTVSVSGERPFPSHLLYAGPDTDEVREEVARLQADIPGQYRTLKLDELRARYASGAADIAARASTLSDLADRIREQELG